MGAVAGRRDQLITVLELLCSAPSPAGGERRVAEQLAGWCRSGLTGEDAVADLDVFDGERANLLVHRGRADGLACYAHLDTSLTGDSDRDWWITGRGDAPPAALRIEGDAAVGFGVAVAKASAAIALVAFDVAATALLAATGAPSGVSAVLTAGGTHRWPFTRVSSAGSQHFGVGARRALARGFRPAGVVNVKAGAPAPLHAEPGAAYLTVLITGVWEPALFRGAQPGTIAAVAALLDGVERWRVDLRRRPLPAGSIVGREAALGAVRSGDLDKPDLMPGLVTGRVFLVLAEGDDPTDLAGDLRRAVVAACADALVGPVEVQVTVDVHDAAASTDPSDPLVVAAHAAWTRHIGAVAPVDDWRGSTDGCAFRAAGIPTVRMGPPAVRDDHDPRLDRIDLTVALAHTAATVETIVRWTLAARPPTGRAGTHP